MLRRTPRLAAASLATCALGVVAGCSGAEPAALDPGAPASTATSVRSSEARTTPSPDDAHAAVPEVVPGRTVSPAQGPVRLAVRARRPGDPAAAAAYDAYLGWVRAYLAAFARPGAGDSQLRRCATPAVAGLVSRQSAGLASRGWAEYGTASVVSVVARVAASAASVVACLDLSGLATRDAQGRLAGRERPVRSTASLTAAGGRWLVAADEKTAVARCG